ncbi:hypothetical protein RHSIM_Rhsim12G0090200 [Rhododendron simsii]|uniref:Uncharacterized protein n=1 Tax=Rhododendron simsii TaxID=118357 RepID=A0A834L956_RHOSS|nr:hypothetical protein RHSIM_Rhsim12G0090200 [Rhododendron simsii]
MGRLFTIRGQLRASTAEAIMEALDGGHISEREVCVQWWKLGRWFYGFRLRDESRSHTFSLLDIAMDKEEEVLGVLRRGAIHEGTSKSSTSPDLKPTAYMRGGCHAWDWCNPINMNKHLQVPTSTYAPNDNVDAISVVPMQEFERKATNTNFITVVSLIFSGIALVMAMLLEVNGDLHLIISLYCIGSSRHDMPYGPRPTPAAIIPNGRNFG